MYRPMPADVEDIRLPEELLELTEEIAENVHEVWAEGRIKDGWTYGPVRDSERKETPMLVPYDQLPESEKDFDRNTALYTLRYVIKRGYKISLEK
ncbi:MAG: Ryanodine receptor Ryr [Mogibacterium sp.]|nr:Ryanodine receptor Ryr [Mogibacterium sp.]